MSRTLAEDRDIIDRIIAAYHCAIASAPSQTRQAMCGTIWGEKGVIGMQGGLIHALEQRSPSAVHDILRRYFVTDAAFGIAMGQREAEIVGSHPAHRTHYGNMWLDRCVMLAYATGAISIPNPEDSADRWQASLESDADQVFAALENHLGITIRFPNLCGVFGGEIRGEPFPFIAFTHLLVACQMRAWLTGAKPTVFEIGGGFGGLAYWMLQLRDCSYTIFDLPFANAVQAYFLSRALPGRSLALYGEKGPADIMLAPGWALHQRHPKNRVDLVVNQDSMPEMPQATACKYLESIKQLLDGVFLSVNQEPPPHSGQTWDRTSVANLMQRVGGFVRLVRSPFFLRLGYVQEVYRPAHLGLFSSSKRHALKSAGLQRRTPFRTAVRLMRQGDLQGIRDRLGKRLAAALRGNGHNLPESRP